MDALDLRVEERLYIDSWGLKASTTDAKLLIDVGKQGRIWPHLRFHVQDDVDFWRLAYPVYDNAVAGCAPQGSTAPCLPALRTGDRELGNLLGLTVGLGGRFAFGAKKNFAVALTTDVVYTRFFETLFILQRFGFLGALTLEAAF